MAWTKVITTAGLALIASAPGKIFNFTRAVCGSGTVPVASLPAQTAVSGYVEDLSITEVTYSNNICKARIQLNNIGNTTAFELAQIGIYAKVGTGAAVLFMILQNDNPEIIPTEAEFPSYVEDWLINSTISNASSVTASIDTSAFVTQGSFASQLSGKLDTSGNGSEVTAAFEAAATRENINTGEKLSVIFGKIKKYFADLGTAAYKSIPATGDAGESEVVLGNDTRLNDSRSPSAHAASHKSGGADALTPGDIGAEEEGTADDAVDSHNNAADAHTAGIAGNAATATKAEKLKTARAINGMGFDGSAGIDNYSTCSTAASTAAKVVAKTGFSLLTGSWIRVKFSNTDTAGNCKLNVNSTGSKAIYYAGTAIEAKKLEAGSVYDFVYDGTRWVVVGGLGGGGMMPTLTVNIASAATVVASCSGVSISLTQKSTNVWTAEIPSYGTWAITATNANSRTATTSINVDTVKQYAIPLAFFTAYISVTYPAGSTCTCSDGTTTLNGGTSGSYTFNVPNTGTWTVLCTDGTNTASDTVSITADGQSKSASLSYIKIFGVVWNYANSSTALTRLLRATDPNGHVTDDITTEPSPVIGTGAGSSPFDNFAPWNGMVKSTLSTGDVMVWIPAFYYKLVKDTANSKYYFYIADKATTGFSLHPGSGRYVGRYHTITQSSVYYSKSGASPQVNMTRATARTNSKAKGTGWYQLDLATWNAIELLYLVEYADWNGQIKIGRGNVDSGSVQSTGQTDSMTYHTGRVSGSDGSTAVQYRWIEEPWGNVRDWCDGVNFNSRVSYICTNPANYADDTSTNHTAGGITLPSSGYIKGLGNSSSFPWLILPDTNGGSETTYIPDYVYSYTGWCVLYVGGYYGNASNAGPFYFYGSYASSYAYAYIGARLLKLP